MGVKFDFLSDSHIDFWVRLNSNTQKYEMKTREFAKELLKSKTADYLIIAGDIGHYNRQNKFFLDELSKEYKNIYLVFGNHDLYFVSSKQSYKYNFNSFNRIKEMKEWIDEQNNIHYLDGNIVDVEGVKITGANMWYDFSYGLSIGNTKEQILYKWHDLSNDSRLISRFDMEKYFLEEKSKLDLVVENADVIVTHVGPDVRLSDYSGSDRIYNNFYFFNGMDFIEDLENKIWLFGHIHKRRDISYNGWRIINHALGYKDQGFSLEVKSFEV